MVRTSGARCSAADLDDTGKLRPASALAPSK
jgi:hypothetical protein